MRLACSMVFFKTLNSYVDSKDQRSLTLCSNVRGFTLFWLIVQITVGRKGTDGKDGSIIIADKCCSYKINGIILRMRTIKKYKTSTLLPQKML